MWFEYRCEECGTLFEDQRFAKIGYEHPEYVCCVGARLIRIVSMPQVAPPTPEAYFNHSIGEVCTTSRDFEEKLRVKALKATDEDGMERKHVPLYPSEGRAYVEKTSGPNMEIPS